MLLRMKNFTTLWLFVFITSLFTSCTMSFQKRRYRPGYHIEVHNNHSKENISTHSAEPKINLNTNNAVLVKHSKEAGVLKRDLDKIEVVEEQKSNPSISQKKVRENKKRELDSCDIIFMATGERIQAKVYEITDEFIHYKKCDDPKGRLYTIKSKLVDNITLRNGELYVPPSRIIIDKEKERKKSGVLLGLAIGSLSLAVIAFIFSFFIPPFAGLSFGFSIFNLFFSFILLLLDIRPGRYVPSYRTRLTWIFCLIVLILIIASLVIVLL